MNIFLNDVTICAVDCANINLASRALDKSLLECFFGEAILFSDTSPTNISNKKWIEINKIKDRNDYSTFILKHLHQYIETAFVLIVQWDGYVLNAKKWDDQFYKYDYIGAPWYWHNDGMNVGNGGFSLRSKRLLSITATDHYPFIENMNEDDQVCRHYRSKLITESCITFAPEELAHQFSYERSLPNAPTFGFHGIFNMWRYLNDAELVEFTRELNPYIFHSIEYFELMLQYLIHRKFNALEILYGYVKKNCSTEEIKQQFQRLTNDEKTSGQIIQTCNDL
jgi:hypothetical protein